MVKVQKAKFQSALRAPVWYCNSSELRKQGKKTPVLKTTTKYVKINTDCKLNLNCIREKDFNGFCYDLIKTYTILVQLSSNVFVLNQVSATEDEKIASLYNWIHWQHKAIGIFPPEISPSEVCRVTLKAPLCFNFKANCKLPEVIWESTAQKQQKEGSSHRLSQPCKAACLSSMGWKPFSHDRIFL